MTQSPRIQKFTLISMKQRNVFLKNIRTAAKNIFSDGEISWIIRADLDWLDNRYIEHRIEDVDLASYTLEGQEFTLYKREVKHPQ